MLRNKPPICLPDPCILAEKYTIIVRLGQGSFGHVYLALDENNEQFAIKVDPSNEADSHLRRENKMYRRIGPGKGISNIYWFGQQWNHTFLVMDLLGMSLHELLQRCHGSFSLKTILLIIDQIIDRLELMHSKYILHRDVKPTNFVIGAKGKRDLIHIIDFGLSGPYRDTKTRHFKNEPKGRRGTPLYASLNIHNRQTASRRDDLESVAYMIIYFFTGALPWQFISNGIITPDSWLEIEKFKKNMSPEELCKSCPQEFCTFLKLTRSLGYDEDPDYKMMKTLFRSLAEKHGIEYDNKFDWENIDLSLIPAS